MLSPPLPGKCWRWIVTTLFAQSTSSTMSPATSEVRAARNALSMMWSP